ncbi:PTS sugar transporter subunit IIA [Risungbinella massiliensis]|uniref:PTS sugar transporter subunit IIA n=1 Tax=Risungbinella massiliensis TaxID=1329796 RepID=UPI0005CBB57D|nr:PTS sugar transporter subunit IIA [Risungbinella massiliensis]
MNEILTLEKIKLNVQVSDKWEAIRKTGELLLEGGHIQESYIVQMIEREKLSTTYMGNGLAIPHGTNEAKKYVSSTGISLLQVPAGVDFGDGNIAYILVGIAGVGDEHLEVLSQIAIFCSDEENVKRLAHANTKEEILKMFQGGN